MTRFTFSTSAALSLWCLILMSSSASAQVGKDSGLWQWTEYDTHHAAIVEVHSGGGSGTGVLISIDEDKKIAKGHEGYVLTAWHVVQDDVNAVEPKIKVKFRGQKVGSKNCRVIQYDEHKDVALVWVWVPEGIEPVAMATDPIKSGDKLEFAGLGGGSKLDCCIRHFSATASSPSSLEKIFADVPLLPGDSGGPVFNEKKEVVGIISGGWFWWNSGLKTNDGNQNIRTTWPARASNVGPIQSLMAKLNEVESTTTKKY